MLWAHVRTLLALHIYSMSFSNLWYHFLNWFWGCILHEQIWQDRKRWMGSPAELKMYGLVWVQLYSYSYIVKPLVSTGRVILSFLCKNRLRKQSYGLVGPPLLPIKNVWSMGSPWQRAMPLESLLMSGCSLSHEFVQMAWKKLGEVLSVKTQGIHKLKATPKE